ncbi:MAG TPA: type II toxin-antitoxin system prevent-host-death family antitoxin [Longimicrobiales bacterium]|jgi:prevent-host-death family protein
MLDSVYMGKKRRVHTLEVGVRDLRANLAHWLDEVRKGREVVVTERGVPVARLLKAGEPTTLERLIADGTVTPPRKPKTPITEPAIAARGSVTDILLQQRREDPY